MLKKPSRSDCMLLWGFFTSWTYLDLDKEEEIGTLLLPKVLLKQFYHKNDVEVNLNSA